jgi:endonuclease III related protein
MDSLHTVYTRLHSHFGPLTGSAARHPWWPIFGNDPPFEMLVGAVLVQQTRWETVEAAVLRLLEAELLSPPAMAAAPPETLAEVIRPAAFHRQKAPGLVAIAGYISTHYAGSTAAMLAQPTSELRSALLALPRIGRESCDVIMLYGGNHPVFVVDEYTRRLFERVDPTLERSTQDVARRTQDVARRTQNAERPRSALWRAPYETVRQTIEAELSDPQPSALSPQPSALSPQPSALSPQPPPLSPQPSALSPQPSALSPQPSTLSPQPSALSPQPSALSPQPSALNPQPSALSPQPALLSDPVPCSLFSVPSLYADYHAQINEVCVRYCLSRPRCDGPPARRVYSRQAGREHYHGREDGCPLRAVCRYYREQVNT